MKYLFFLLVIGGSFIACDKRTDYFKELNQGAAVIDLNLTNSHSWYSATISQSGRSITDTLKLGNDYTFSFSFVDESDSVLMAFEGAGTLQVNGTVLSGSANVTPGQYSCVWTPLGVGTHEFVLSLTDDYDVVMDYTFRIVVFENRVPTINWMVEHIGDLSPLHKRIVVSGGDGDAIYGGTILYYQYIIDHDTTSFPNSQMDYIFPSTGYYDIGVRAMDSNYEWSNYQQINDYYISN